MMKTFTPILLLTYLLIAFTSCDSPIEESHNAPDSEKIVSLSGPITEVLFELGLGSQIAGVDVTSTFPEQVADIPKVGHTSQIQSEGVLSLEPTLVFAKKGEVQIEILEQIRAAGVKVIELEQEYTVQGTLDFIQTICDSMNVSDQSGRLKAMVTEPLQEVRDLPAQPSVLFIYARGTGNLTVAGERTPIENVIQLAGGRNAVSGFTEFKPLSPEILVAADPDVLLMFSSSLSSLDGASGLMQIPGVSETKAGKQHQIFEMEGALLAGFGPRLGLAVKELNQYLLSIAEAE